MKTKFLSKRSSKQGFALLEVMISLAVTGIALLSIVYMFTVALTQQDGNLRKTEAINILSNVTSDMQVTPATSTSYSPFYQIQLGINKTIYTDIHGGIVSSGSPSAVFCIQVHFNAVSSPSTTSSGTVLIYWPAQQQNYTSSITSFFAMN